MVSLLAPNEAFQSKTPQAERKVHGEFTQRVIAQSRNAAQEQVSWVARTSSQGQMQLSRSTSKATSQLDSNGLSWESTLNAEPQPQNETSKQVVSRILSEKHRERVGAERAMPDTPTAKPLFGKNPVVGKFSLARFKEASKPKSLIGALLS